MNKWKLFSCVSTFILILLTLQIASAMVLVQYEGQNVDYAVIENEYTIYSTENILLDVDQLNLIQEGDVNMYSWITSNQSGLREFNIFNFSVVSKLDEIINQVENFTINLNQDNSSVSMNFDIGGTTLETLDLSYGNYFYHMNFVNFLRGINGDIILQEGEEYPNVSSFIINSSTATMAIEGILMEENHNFTVDDLNLQPQYYINYLIDYYDLTYTYPSTIHGIKNGDYYYLSTSDGYSYFSGNEIEQIRNAIEDKIYYLNPLEIIDQIFKLTDENIGDYTNFPFEELNFSIDFQNLILQDGEYNLILNYQDQFGNYNSKDFLLILDLATIEEIDINTTYIPESQEVLEVIQEISGLPHNSQVSISVYGNNLPTSFTHPPSKINSIGFMEINLSVNQTGNFKVNFSVPSNLDKNKIRAYVFEDSWVELPTYYLSTSDKHYFYFETTHFSKFMIGEIVVSTGNEGGSNKDSSPSVIIIEQINELVDTPNPIINLNEPIDLTPEEDFQKSNNSIIYLWMILIILILIAFLLLIMIIKLKKKKKKNDKIL